MANPVGPLLPADEQFTHQVVDTFATVGTTDPSWTEKVCAMAAARDGSLQLGFGLGKYTNRNVMDAYSGVSRGVEQMTVRASRRLQPEPELTVIGPIRYEVLEPLRTIRFALDANDCQPIAFDWVFESVVPPHVEERTHTRDHYRVSAELVRYHQTGVAAGGWRSTVSAPRSRPRPGCRPRPLVGRALRRGRAAHRHAADRGVGDLRRRVVRVPVEPDAHGTSRRHALRDVAGVVAGEGAGFAREEAHGTSSTPTAGSRRSSASPPSCRTTRRTDGCAAGASP